jgi:hypothetical protein
MATNPFANLGLGNMGQEVGILSTAGDSLKNMLAGQVTKAMGGTIGAMMGGDNKMGAALMNPATYGGGSSLPAVPAMSAPPPQMNPNPAPPALPALQLPGLNQPTQPDPNLPSYSRFLFSPKE